MPPSTDYFLYLIDESPNTAQTEQWAQWILQNPGPGQRLRSMATISLPTAAAKTPSLGIPTSFLEVGVPTRVRYRPTCARSRDTAWRSWSAKVPGYNLHIMLVGSRMRDRPYSRNYNCAGVEGTKHAQRESDNARLSSADRV